MGVVAQVLKAAAALPMRGAQALTLAAAITACGAPPPPPLMSPAPTVETLDAKLKAPLDESCVPETRLFYRRAWRSIDGYLEEIKPLLSYLSALDGAQVSQRLHRAHYIAEFQEQVFQRFRLMERVADRCEAARPRLLRYREELIQRLSSLM